MDKLILAQVIIPCLTTNSNGCDSIANLNLIINSTSSSVTTINSCVPVTWNGQTYTLR